MQWLRSLPVIFQGTTTTRKQHCSKCCSKEGFPPPSLCLQLQDLGMFPLFILKKKFVTVDSWSDVFQDETLAGLLTWTHLVASTPLCCLASSIYLESIFRASGALASSRQTYFFTRNAEQTLTYQSFSRTSFLGLENLELVVENNYFHMLGLTEVRGSQKDMSYRIMSYRNMPFPHLFTVLSLEMLQKPCTMFELFCCQVCFVFTEQFNMQIYIILFPFGPCLISTVQVALNVYANPKGECWKDFGSHVVLYM